MSGITNPALRGLGEGKPPHASHVIATAVRYDPGDFDHVGSLLVAFTLDADGEPIFGPAAGYVFSDGT